MAQGRRVNWASNTARTGQTGLICVWLWALSFLWLLRHFAWQLQNLCFSFEELIHAPLCFQTCFSRENETGPFWVRCLPLSSAKVSRVLARNPLANRRGWVGQRKSILMCLETESWCFPLAGLLLYSPGQPWNHGNPVLYQNHGWLKMLSFYFFCNAGVWTRNLKRARNLLS